MIHPREEEIQAALRQHWPALDYRQIGQLLQIRRWSKVRLVHEAMQAEQATAPERERAVGEPAPAPAPIARDTPAPARTRPELSRAASIALELLPSFADDPVATAFLRRRYLVARAVDFGLYHYHAKAL